MRRGSGVTIACNTELKKCNISWSTTLNKTSVFYISQLWVIRPALLAHCSNDRCSYMSSEECVGGNNCRHQTVLLASIEISCQWFKELHTVGVQVCLLKPGLKTKASSSMTNTRSARLAQRASRPAGFAKDIGQSRVTFKTTENR